MIIEKQENGYIITDLINSYWVIQKYTGLNRGECKKLFRQHVIKIKPTLIKRF